MLEWIKKIFKKETKPETSKADFKELQKPDIEIEEEEDNSEQLTLPPAKEPSDNEQSQP